MDNIKLVNGQLFRDDIKFCKPPPLTFSAPTYGLVVGEARARTVKTGQRASRTGRTDRTTVSPSVMYYYRTIP